MTLKRGSSHIIPCPARFMLCCWRHNRLAMTSQWPDKCDANTWQVKSNSLDIDFFTAIFTAGRVRNNHIRWHIINHDNMFDRAGWVFIYEINKWTELIRSRVVRLSVRLSVNFFPNRIDSLSCHPIFPIFATFVGMWTILGTQMSQN